MKKFNHYVAIRVNRWGKGLLGDNVQIEEYDHIYFGKDECMEDAYKLIDKLFRAGKRDKFTISLYEAGELCGEAVRRLVVKLEYDFHNYGVAEVGVCDRNGCYNRLVHMDAKTARYEAYSVLEDVALKQYRSEEVA